jgi:hypothetical protein
LRAFTDDEFRDEFTLKPVIGTPILSPFPSISSSNLSPFSPESTIDPKNF